MRRRWFLAILLAVVLGAGSFAAARLVTGEHAPAETCCPGFLLLQRYLELSDKQREAIAGIDARYFGMRPQLRNRLWETRDNLLSVLRDPQSTREQAEEATRQFGAAQQAMQLNTISYTFELRKHLTPQQRTRMHRLLGRGMCSATCGAGMCRGTDGPMPGCPNVTPAEGHGGRGPQGR